MGDRDRTYYDDRSLERGDWNHRNSYESRSRPRYDDSPSTREYHYTRTSDKDIVRYNDDRYDDDRTITRHRRSSTPTYYGHTDRRHDYHDRDNDYHSRDLDRDRDHHHHHQSHSHSHDRHKHEDHHDWKNAAATLIGGLAGAQAARKASKDSRLGTVAGVVAGAWGGHELEKEWEHHEAKERRRRDSERR